MAGDFLLVQSDLADRREVLLVAEQTGLSRHEVLGLLVHFWSWATQETESGRIPGATISTLTAAVGPDSVRVLSEDRPSDVRDMSAESFWKAVEAVGWLRLDSSGITIPNFDRWLSRTAKARVRDRLRKREARQNVPKLSESQRTRTGRGARDDERDKNQRKKEAPSPSPSLQFSKEEVLSTWNRLAQQYDLPGITDLTEDRRRKLWRCLQEVPDFWNVVEKRLSTRNAWCREKRMPSFDQLLRPSFRQKLLEGNFDGEKGAQEPEPQEQEDRRRLVAELQGREGQTALDSKGREFTAERGGLYGADGFRPWSMFQIPDLQKLADGTLLRWLTASGERNGEESVPAEGRRFVSPNEGFRTQEGL